MLYCQVDGHPISGRVYQIPVKRLCAGDIVLRGAYCSLSCAKRDVIDRRYNVTLFSWFCRQEFATEEIVEAPPRELLKKHNNTASSLSIEEYRKTRTLPTCYEKPILPFILYKDSFISESNFPVTTTSKNQTKYSSKQGSSRSIKNAVPPSGGLASFYSEKLENPIK